MLKSGFVEETNPEVAPPDVAITVSVMTSDNSVYYWYPYWGWILTSIKIFNSQALKQYSLLFSTH